MALPNINQFNISTVQGQVDLLIDSTVVSGIISPNEATSLVPGQAVKLEDSSAPTMRFLAVTSPTDPIFGYITRTVKDINYTAGEGVEVGIDGTVMYMTAGAAIARGATVEYDNTNVRVIRAAGVNPTTGIAFDKATALGDLVRVLIRNPAASSPALRQAVVVATLAEINAGKVLIPGVAGKQITVTSFVERVLGAFATGTSVDLQAETTGTKIEVSAEAALTNGAVLIPGSANVTLGAGFGAPLPAGEGVKVVNVGAAQTGGTSITYTITYAVM